MQSVDILRTAVSPAARGIAVRLPRLSTEIVVFAALAALYVTLGAILVFGVESISGDALSRVANAYYVFYSRDPHLAAMGFIWSPLPSALTLPFLPLMTIWPGLVRDGFITNLWSAVFMAAAAVQLYRLGVDLRVPRTMSIVGVALFALHPYVMQYGANGMSEAMFVFFVVATTRQLARWIESRSSGSLVAAGLWLGGAYLVRYEAAPMAAASALVVLGLTYRAAGGTRAHRLTAGMADAVVYAAPFAAAFVLWAAASWILIGSPFAQFSSAYGISSQLEADTQIFEGTGQGTPLAILFTFGQMLSLEPQIVPLVILGVGVGVLRRDARILAPVAIFGAVVAFTVWAWLTGRTGGWLRYYIVLVPLATTMTLWALTALNPLWKKRTWSWAGPFARIAPRAARAVGFALAAAIFVPAALGLPAGARTVAGDDTKQPEGRITDARQHQAAARVASFVDGLDSGHGTVLVDAFMGYPVILSSREPKQFVITPDRDFEVAVSNPWAFGIEYLLVPPLDRGWGELDRLNREWPDLYENGAGIASLVREFPTIADRYVWRLYRLDDAGISSP